MTSAKQLKKMKLVYDLSKSLTHQSIANVLGIPRSTVTDNVSRYKLKLIRAKYDVQVR